MPRDAGPGGAGQHQRVHKADAAVVLLRGRLRRRRQRRRLRRLGGAEVQAVGGPGGVEITTTPVSQNFDIVKKVFFLQLRSTRTQPMHGILRREPFESPDFDCDKG